MSSSPLINRAAMVLRQVTDKRPADQVLREFVTTHREWSPIEKRALARMVFAYFRWFGWADQAESLQNQIEQIMEVQARFERDPASIKVEALAVRAVPAWVREELDCTPEFLRRLQREPVLWLRPRTGRHREVSRVLGDCEEVRVERRDSRFVFLDAASGPHCPPTAHAAWPDDCHLGLLRYGGRNDLFQTAPFREGEFEIQDIASQMVGRFCAPKAGQTWWDACAGEGGKLLHLSDLMGGKGLIWASDRSERRLEILKRRASRASAFNYRCAAWEGGAKLPTRTPFDGILVDAPCSGLGTWQRNPHARWTTSPRDVAELAEIQKTLLGNAASGLKPGGRLVYSVCTLTRSETVAVADAFSAQHTECEPVFRGTIWPQDLEGNGMFIAAWRKR